MNKSFKFVLIIFLIIIIPLIILAFFYVDAQARDDIKELDTEYQEVK